MILKKMDDKEANIARLQGLLGSATGALRPKIEEELRILSAGLKGEQESAYLIDFAFERRDNWAVIHDLRLEHRGRTAQIDHLLLNRFLECYVLETKHFAASMKITEEGEFLRWNNYRKTYEGMASPLAQNERHIAVLREVFGRVCTETRLGVQLSPTFHSLVLVNAKARIDRPKKFDTRAVIKADMLSQQIDHDTDTVGVLSAIKMLSKMVSKETLHDLGRKLVRLHRPMPLDYAVRFGLGATPAEGCPAEPAAKAAAARLTDSVPGMGATAAPVAEGRKNGAPRCRNCGGAELAILYGKYGYYFKCSACSGNTPVKVDCGVSGHKERVRKDGARFFRECAECGTSSLYFTNPAGGARRVGAPEVT